MISEDSINKTSLKINRYRPEIDGLRAFAVLAVIINHFNKDLLPSGYLGVDIFFVISGFVITSSLYKRPSNNFREFISKFYFRRIKRLIPALSVFVFITGFLIAFLNGQSGLSLLTGITSLFGLSNLYLLQNSTNYFAETTQLNPFLQTWSLSVEEQFYLIFPFLVWFSGFGKQTMHGAKNLFYILGGISFTSLIVYIYLYPINQSAAYFLMPSRFWEISTGCLIFIGFYKRPSLEKFFKKIPSLIIILLIFGLMFLPSYSAPISTIVLVLLTFFLLSSLKQNTLAFKIFTNKAVVFIGNISYSLYLWHWGVLAISRWTIGIYWWTVPIQILITTGLAICSYNFIEVPFRKDKYFNLSRFYIFFSGIGLILLTSFSLIGFKKFASSLKFGDPISLLGSTAENEKCMVDEIEKCLIRTNQKKAVFAIGDSHTMHLAPSLREALKEFNRDLYIWGRPEHVVSIFSHKNDKCLSKDCIKDEIKKIKDTLNAGKFGKGDIFLYSISRNRLYLNREYKDPQKLYYFEGKSRNSNENLKDIKLLKWTINELAKFAISLGGNVVLVDDIPVACNSQDFYARFIKCSTSKEISLSDRQPLTNLLKSISTDNQNIFYLDPHNAMCPGKICQSSLNGLALYADNSPHIALENKYVLKDFFKNNFDFIFKKTKNILIPL